MESAQSIPSVRSREVAAYVPHKRRIHLRTILLHAILIAFCLVIVIPIAWVLLLSIKSINDAYNGTLWPQEFDFTHYSYVFTHLTNAIQNFANSIIVTTSTVIVTSIIAVLAGYALVHLQLPGRVLVVSILVGTLFFPTRVVSLIGIFQIQNALHLINTLPGLILPYITLNLALSILIMRSIFEQISPELVDAARIDGASSWRTLTQIMLPLVVNGLVVLVIVNFVTAWGEYLLAMTLTNDQSMRTLPVVLVTTLRRVWRMDVSAHRRGLYHGDHSRHRYLCHRPALVHERLDGRGV